MTNLEMALDAALEAPDYEAGFDAEMDVFDDDAMNGELDSDQESLGFEFFDSEGESFEVGGDFELFADEFGGPGSGALTEQEVFELANELTNLETPEQLEAFLGKIFKKAKRGIRKLTRRVGGRILRAGSSVVGRALPLVGASLGNVLVPGAGGAIGGALGRKLGSAVSGFGKSRLGRGLVNAALGSASKSLGMNPLASMLAKGRSSNLLRSLLGFEAGSQAENPQLEVAKRVVRVVADASQAAGNDPEADTDPDSAVARAYGEAMQRHLPEGVRAAMVSGSTDREAWY